MDPINVAIAAIELQELGEELSYRSVAEMYGVSRSTLARRHKGRQARLDEKNNS